MPRTSSFSPFSGPFRSLLCLCLLCTALLLAGCKTEIYQKLSEEEANTMLSVLLRHGISAEKSAAKSGYTIAIDKAHIVQALEILKQNSLPRTEYQNLGQVFSAQGMIPSATEKQARLSFALSQELANTFSRIDGVLTARVHVVLGQTDLATGAVTPASAAVFLRHTPESQATRLIPNIRELTANAVPGLMQDNVSVMLVPVRETVSVPMAKGKDGAVSGSSRQIILALAALLGLALAALAGALYMLRRRGKNAAA